MKPEINEFYTKEGSISAVITYIEGRYEHFFRHKNHMEGIEIILKPSQIIQKYEGINQYAVNMIMAAVENMNQGHKPNLVKLLKDVYN